MPFGRDDLDLGEEGAIERVLEGMDFDVIVNAAALTNVDECERREDEAEAVNAIAPGRLAEAAKARGARMVQVSTDYVLDGEAPGLRVEGDGVAPLGVYARTKLAGEWAVLAVSPDFPVVRTSWIFGPDRPGFVEGILGRALREPRVEAIEDKEAAPTYSLDFAEHLEALLEHPGAGGVVHLCNAGACSWKEFGQAVLDFAAEAGLPLRARTVDGMAMDQMGSFVAKRPRHTAMATKVLEALTGRRPRPWREALAEYVVSDLAGRCRKGRL